ncbi:MAG: deoxynucleoside kinase [Bradymonadaceae bacterium]|nr:deoxynucleoside kinase [Lujinxingiaceae bacterium]
MSSKIFVAMAGNIGAGKSTAATILARHFGCELFYEPVVENRFLRSYYRNMTRWSFTLQMEFLLQRVEHHAQIDRLRGSCVQDRTLIEDPEVFAKYLHGLGHMTDTELDLYFDFFKRFNSGVRQPDKVILLHTPDVRVLMRRIDERGREEESGITAEFLRGLNCYYDNFAQVARRKYGLDVLEIDVTERDFRKGQERDAFLEEVRAFLSAGLTPDNELPFFKLEGDL